MSGFTHQSACANLLTLKQESVCRSVLPVGQLELLPGFEGVPEGSATINTHLRPRFMALDGAALENLEV